MKECGGRKLPLGTSLMEMMILSSTVKDHLYSTLGTLQSQRLVQNVIECYRNAIQWPQQQRHGWLVEWEWGQVEWNRGRMERWLVADPLPLDREELAEKMKDSQKRYYSQMLNSLEMSGVRDQATGIFAVWKTFLWYKYK